MLIKTKAIVLNIIPYQDNKQIVSLFTETHGKISAINYHSTTPRKNRNPSLQIFFLLELEINYNEIKSLHTIKEFRIQPQYTSIPYKNEKRAIALFLSEIMYRFLQEDGPNKELFIFTKSAILYLDLISSNYADFHLIFLLKLSKYLGFELPEYSNNFDFFDLVTGEYILQKPTHNNYLTKEHSNILQKLQKIKIQELEKQQTELSAQQRINIAKKLIEFFQIHHSNSAHIQSLQILEELFK